MTLYLVGCNHCNPPAVKKLKCPVPLVDWFGWFPEKGTVICCLSRSFQLNDTSHSSLYLFPKGSDKTWMWLKDMGVANKKWIPNNHGHISPFSPVFHHLSLSLGMDFNPWNSPYSVFFQKRTACRLCSATRGGSAQCGTPGTWKNPCRTSRRSCRTSRRSWRSYRAIKAMAPPRKWSLQQQQRRKKDSAWDFCGVETTEKKTTEKR